MRPASTRYRLATEADEAALRALPQGDVPRRFPTIVAERDGAIVGYLATHDRPDMILAGPLEVVIPEGHSRGVMALRLIQAYEFVLGQFDGVHSYFYATADPAWIEATTRCERTRFCYEYPNGLHLFERDLPTDGTVH